MDRDVRAIELQNQNAGAWLRSSVDAIEMNSIFTSISLFAGKYDNALFRNQA